MRSASTSFPGRMQRSGMRPGNQHKNLPKAPYQGARAVPLAVLFHRVFGLNAGWRACIHPSGPLGRFARRRDSPARVSSSPKRAERRLPGIAGRPWLVPPAHERPQRGAAPALLKSLKLCKQNDLQGGVKESGVSATAPRKRHNRAWFRLIQKRLSDMLALRSGATRPQIRAWRYAQPQCRG